MGWQGIADNVTISAGTRIRLTIDTAASVGVGDEAFRTYIPQYASFSVETTDYDLLGAPLLTKWRIVGVVTQNVVVGQLRADIANAIAAMRSEWLIGAASMSLDTVEIEKTSIIPDIPVTTTISLVAFAVLGLVAVWFVYKFTK